MVHSPFHFLLIYFAAVFSFSCGTDSGGKKPTAGKDNANGGRTMDQVNVTFSDSSGKTGEAFTFDCTSTCNVSIKINVAGIENADLLVGMDNSPPGAVIKSELSGKVFFWSSPQNISGSQVLLSIRNFATCIAIEKDEKKCNDTVAADTSGSSTASNTASYEVMKGFSLTVTGVKSSTAQTSGTGTATGGSPIDGVIGALGGLVGGGGTGGGTGGLNNIILPGPLEWTF